MTFDFSGLEKAQIFEKGNPLPEGAFDLEVTRVLSKRTRKGDAFIVEFKVLDAYGNPKVNIGEKRTWFQKLTDTDIAFPSIKEFVVATLGLDKTQEADKKTIDTEVGPQLKGIVDTAVDAGSKPDAGLNGSKVHVNTFKKKTQKDTDFTVHDWSPYKAKAA
jgi:hypothetical protein